jgi:ribosomal protein S18 acetylase RimI-like enzyme
VIEIRDIRDGEHAEAGEVTVDGYRDFYRELGSYAELLRDVQARAREAAVLVAVDEGAILGTVTYVPDSRSAYAQHQRDGEGSIRMLSVSPKHMGRGVGRALSERCIERARDEGKRRIMLHADETMKVARHLYETLGFRRDPSRDFAPDEETALLCYVLDL